MGIVLGKEIEMEDYKIGWLYEKPQIAWKFPEQKSIPCLLPRIDWATTKLLREKFGGFVPIFKEKYPGYSCLRIRMMNCTPSFIEHTIHRFKCSGTAAIETDSHRDRISGTITSFIEFYVKGNGKIYSGDSYYGYRVCLSEEMLRYYTKQPCWLHVWSPDFLEGSDLIAKEKSNPRFPPLIADKVAEVGVNPLSGEPDKVWARILANGDSGWEKKGKDGYLWQWINFERPGVYARFYL